MIKKRKKISGGQAAVQSLKKENVKHVFGLIGSATMEMFDALYHEKSIKFIGVRDERTGTHMADGYARASNKPGVILAGQNGPGATNLVTGIAQAKAAFSPVVAIAGGLGVFTPRKPPVSDLPKFENKSIFYIVKDPSIFENQNLVISGGGDSALDWALYFAENNACLLYTSDAADE